MGIGQSGGFGPGFRTMAGQQYQKPWPQTVFESVGGDKPEVIESQQPMRPPQQPVMQQPPASPPQHAPPTSYAPTPRQEYGESARGPAPEPGMVWSQKSKRWVRYTRKPYDKHENYKSYPQY